MRSKPGLAAELVAEGRIAGELVGTSEWPKALSDEAVATVERRPEAGRKALEK